MSRRRGPLYAIGGHEDKDRDRQILRAISDELGSGPLIIATVASHEPEGYFEAYRDAFAALGRQNLVEVYFRDRSEAHLAEHAALVDTASGIFFSGGDQARLVDMLRGTPFAAALGALHRRGGLIAGTSAGASAQGEQMLVAGSGEETHRIGDIEMAPGLGLIDKVIIDQHFAERGRIGRLLGAVAACPDFLGIGIDEDSALRIESGVATAIGSGGVTIVDAARASRSNAQDAARGTVLSLHGVTLHALGAGDRFDLGARQPVAA